MKTLKANPGARRMLESLRDLGYEFNTAVADIIDNSIAAHASEVKVDIYPREGNRPAAIVISDNGDGMGRSELQEAMRFGAFQTYSGDDLGKFGLGLKTASLSQCRMLTVLSKEKAGRGVRSRKQCMRWDVDHVFKTDDWDLLEPTAQELNDWESLLLNDEVASVSGTVVLWSKLDEGLSLLSANDIQEREKFLAQLMAETRKHLRMVFHRFMQGTVTGHRKLSIKVCGEHLDPWDPFCRKETTRELEIMKYSLIAGSVVVSPFILPREEEFSSTAAWKDASGPRNWNQQQGFYFYRNNRLLQAGGWSNLRAPDEHTKLLRVAIDFTSGLDRSFAINITKMRARIPAELRLKINQELGTWAGTARRRYDGARAKKTFAAIAIPKALVREGSKTETVTPSVDIGPIIFFRQQKNTGSLSVIKNRKTSQIEISVPSKHEVASIFQIKNNYEGEIKKLSLGFLAILEAIYLKKLSPKAIPMEALKKVYKRNI